MLASLGGITKFIPTALYSGMRLLFMGDFMAFFKTCFRTVVCMLGLGPRIFWTFLEVDKTL